MAGIIKQTITFDAAPAKVFESLIDTRKHKAFTGAPAKIGRKAGGAFSAYGGQISGVNLDVVPNKSIVQAWRAKDWPKDAWSIASYTFASAKGGKTKLSFQHAGVPAGKQKTVAAGWSKFYWDPLKKALQDGGAPAKPKAKAKPAAKAKAPAKATTKKT